MQHFRSRPDLLPPVVTVLHPPQTAAPGLLFLAPSSGPGQRGVLILDRAGEVVWFRPTAPRTAMNFRAASFHGEPVLTWWEALPGGGLGRGEHVIVDASYREIARFPAGHGMKSDLHEFLLTARGTALVTSFEVRPRGARGLTMGGVVQELEVPSARVLFEWRSLDHVAVEESYVPIGYPWDYFHVNSIDVDADDNLLVSARNTWAVYKVHRRTGKVLWRLGGKRSDFTLGAGARFAYQHDARSHDGGRVLSVFDNGETHSRGLVLSLDVKRMHASLLREYVHQSAVARVQARKRAAAPERRRPRGLGDRSLTSPSSPPPAQCVSTRRCRTAARTTGRCGSRGRRGRGMRRQPSCGARRSTPAGTGPRTSPPGGSIPAARPCRAAGSRPRFRLRPGRRSVRVVALDADGKPLGSSARLTFP